jgi:hypothetical protein
MIVALTALFLAVGLPGCGTSAPPPQPEFKAPPPENSNAGAKNKGGGRFPKAPK